MTSACFHTNRTGAPATTTSNIHQVAGITTFVLVVVAMFSTICHLRRNEHWADFAAPTFVWSLAAVGTFILIPALGNASFGLAQRIFVATWLSWMIATAARARRTPRTSPVAHEAHAHH